MPAITPIQRTSTIMPSTPGWANVLAKGVPGFIAAYDFVNGQYWSQNDQTGGLVSTFVFNSQYVIFSDGHVSLVSPGNLPVSDLGLALWEASTNLVTFTNDLTNTVWTKTNMTVALNAIGPDLTINSASTLIATAPNATITQPITSTSGTQKASIFIKAVNVTGEINLTIDGGVSWTAIPVGAGWAQLSIPKQTLSNPTFGLRIVNIGDSVAVWCATTEKNLVGAGPTAPMPTGYTTRGVNRVYANIKQPMPWSIAVQTKNVQNAANSLSIFPLFYPNSSAVESFAGVHFIISALGSGDITGVTKVAFGSDSNGRSLVANNGVLTTDNFAQLDLNLPNFGTSVFGANPLDGYDQSVVIWPFRLPDATLQTLSTP